MGPQLHGHIGGHLVGGGLRHAIGHVRDVLLCRPEGDIHDQAPPARDHRPRRQLAGLIVRAHAGAEHRVPAPERLFPERPGPREYPVLEHPFVSAPDVVDEDIDPLRVPGDALERGRHLGVTPMVATNTDNALVRRRGVVQRAAGDEDARPLLGKRPGDPASDAQAPPGDDRDTTFKVFHSERIAKPPLPVNRRCARPLSLFLAQHPPGGDQRFALVCAARIEVMTAAGLLLDERRRPGGPTAQ